MAVARVGTRYQLTLPEEIRRQLAIKEGDMLEVSVSDGGIVLTPIERNPSSKPKPGLTSYIGAGAGVFESPIEADRFVSRERGTWD